MTMDAPVIGGKTGACVHLRAGNADGILELCPSARVGLWLYRDEETLKPVQYYCPPVG